MNLKNRKFLKQIEHLKMLTKHRSRRGLDRKIDGAGSSKTLEINNRSPRKILKEPKTNLLNKDSTPIQEIVDSENLKKNKKNNVLCNSNKGVLQINNSHYNWTQAGNQHVWSNSRKDNGIIPIIENVRRRENLSICVTNSRYSVISKVAKTLGFRIVKESCLWNILWADSVPGIEVYKEMKRFQKINHFPGMIEICRKDLLARNLNRMIKLFPDDYDIFPRTWVFPADLGEAIAYGKEHKNKTFILKPDQGAQGRGIWLTKNLKNINPSERMICQIYINKPLLLDGYKFDLRVYTLITSVDPLRIFVYNEGLARFATTQYREPTLQNTSNVYMHLTNYAVNKRSDMFCKNGEDGSKRSFSAINRILRDEDCDVDQLWRNIDEIIIKTILSAWPMLKHNYHACFSSHDVMQACFEVLGFDILIDRKLKPYVLEVNHSPSFHTQEIIDKEVKEALVRDTLNLLNISLIDKKKILCEDKKRVKTRLLGIKNGTFIPEGASTLTSLGQQIAWEESHLGSYRRIMPPQHPSEPNKYCKFFILQNQASIYSDTAASKRREEASRQIRIALDEKNQKTINTKGLKVKQQKPSPLLNSTSLRAKLNFMERKRKENRLFQEKWSPLFISEMEERERVYSIEKRYNLIHENGTTELIFESFFHTENLSDSDRLRYPDLYDYLIKGNTFFGKYTF